MSGLDPNTGGALVVPGGGGTSLSDATPAALGTAAAGVSTSASRADHVHAAPAAAGITDASATGISLVTAASAAAARTAIGAETAGAAAAVTTTSIGAVPATTLTTRGDLLRRGASAPERFAAVAADTFVGGDGTDVTVRTATQVRTSLRLTNAYEVDPLTSLSGGLATWTAVPSAGSTESIAAGLMSFNTPAGQTSAAARMSYHRAFGVGTARGCDVAVRVASWGAGAAGTLRGILAVASTADPLNTVFAGTDYSIQAYITADDGALSAGEYRGGAFTTRYTGGAGVILLDGTGWMRVIVDAHGYSVWTGVGATYAAAVWTRRVSVPLTAPADTTSLGEILRMSVGAYRAGTTTGDFVVTYADLQIVGL